MNGDENQAKDQAGISTSQPQPLTTGTERPRGIPDVNVAPGAENFIKVEQQPELERSTLESSTSVDNLNLPSQPQNLSSPSKKIEEVREELGKIKSPTLAELVEKTFKDSILWLYKIFQRQRDRLIQSGSGA